MWVWIETNISKLIILFLQVYMFDTVLKIQLARIYIYFIVYLVTTIDVYVVVNILGMHC